MRLVTVGKWLQVVFDEEARVVVLPMGTADRPQTAHVLVAGDGCRAKAGDRILFQKNTVQEAQVDGVKVFLLHEDHLLGILLPSSEAP